MPKKGKPGDGGGTPTNQTIVGTQSDDRLSGGDGDDTIVGHGGNDRLNGNAGFDVAVYSGSMSDYEWSLGHRGIWTVTDNNVADGDDGVDELKNIEALEFADYTYLLNENNVAVFVNTSATTYVDETVVFTISAYDLDDPVSINGTFNPNTQGWLTNITYEYTNLANGRHLLRTMEFDPSTVDRSYLAEGEVEIVTFSWDVGSNMDGFQTHETHITVVGRNDDPTLNAAVFDIVEDGGAVAFDLSALGADADSDDDGSSLTYQIIGLPAGISANVSGAILTLDPGTGFQKLNTGETLDLNLQIVAVDRHGASSAVQDMVVRVHGEDDPVPDYLAADGSINYGAIGVDPALSPNLGHLNGINDDPSYVPLTSFTDADDVRVINAQFLEIFEADTFFYSFHQTTNYDSLPFDTGAGDDTLIYRLRGDALGLKTVDILTGEGEDLVVIDASSTSGMEIAGLNVSTGDHNDQVLVRLDGPGVVQFGLSDFYLGAGNDLLDIKITNDQPSGYGGLASFASTDIFLGDGNDILRIDVSVSNGIWAAIDADISAGHGNDVIEITNAGTVSSSSLGTAYQEQGYNGDIDLGTGDDVLIFDVTALDHENANMIVDGGVDYYLGPTGGYDIVNLVSGNVADFTITESYPGQYTVVQGGQTMHFRNVEEINALDGSLLDLLA